MNTQPRKTDCIYMGHEGVRGWQVRSQQSLLYWDLDYKLDFVRFIDKKRQRVKCGLKEWVIVIWSGLKDRSVHGEVGYVFRAHYKCKLSLTLINVCVVRSFVFVEFIVMAPVCISKQTSPFW